MPSPPSAHPRTPGDAPSAQAGNARDVPGLRDHEPALSAPDNEDQSQSSKMKSLMGILKRVVGVKDLAAIRFSLPANLMEPVPNLEYWTYLDRADLLAAIPDFNDPLDRMLSALRFTLTKDLKVVKNGVCKPYNSILGEHFQCHWDAETPAVNTYPHPHPRPHHIVPVQNLDNQYASPLPIASRGGAPSAIPGPTSAAEPATPARPTDEAAQQASSVPSQKRRIAFLTEQVSHHPPVSTYFGICPEAGIEFSGVDQLSGRFTGTSIRLYAGPRNRGVFLKLLPSAKGHEAPGERYRITHPAASINGLLRGSLWTSMCESTVIDQYGGTRSTDRSDGTGGMRLRALIEYKEEGWISKPKYALEGVIYEYDWPRVPAGASDEDDVPDGEECGPPYYTKVRQVPEDKVVATFEGQWNGRITFRLKDDKAPQEPQLLLDLGDLNVTPKTVRPVEDHGPLESRQIWAPVTEAIQAKQYSQATKAKQEIEQQQRDLAVERERKQQPFVPQFFLDTYPTGRPTLTEAGHKALQKELGLP